MPFLAALKHSIPNSHSISMMALFAVGAFTMRSSACVINDLWDRDIDRQVRNYSYQSTNDEKIVSFSPE